MENTQHTLIFMGTSASCGVPAPYCDCAACNEAREHPEYARGTSSILIRGTERTLIDASPDLRLQLVRQHMDGVERVLFTHEHFDHVGGLPQLEYYVRLISKEPLQLFAGDRCAEYLSAHYDFMDDSFVLNTIDFGDTLEFDGVTYTALKAAHAPGTFGYLMQTERTTAAYFPDTGPLPEQTAERLEGVDLLILDATFNGSNWMPDHHHTIDDACVTAKKLGAKVTYLTHLSMSFDDPITAKELQKKLDSFNEQTGCDVRMALDGLEIPLP